MRDAQQQARNPMRDAQLTLIDVILIESSLHNLSPAQPVTRAVASAGEEFFWLQELTNRSSAFILQSELEI